MSAKGEFQKIFWVDNVPEGTVALSGMFYRTMKLGQFIKDTEEKGYRIVGLRLDESNNGELLFTKEGEDYD